MKYQTIVAGCVLAGLVALGGVGTTTGGFPWVRHARATTQTQEPASTPGPLGQRELPDFTALVEQNGPAVVHISVTRAMQPATDRRDIPGFPENDPFFEFFRRFQVPNPRRESTPMHGLGSGFLISPDGTILTNAHVVAEASEVTVKLTDQREFPAKVVGIDRRTDVAVLKIDATNLPTVKLGDPRQVKVGEWVVAIGAPFGFDNSVTAGIVSAKGRALPDENYVPFIQTDVAVNPGNSGGPLFNMRGEVIGINAQIYSQTGGYMGLSFAVPIDVAVAVKDQLMQNGKVTRGRLGVTIQEVTQPLANAFGLPKPAGALVNSIEKNSPADRAGLHVGDVILKVDGQDVDRSMALPAEVARRKPGTMVQLEVWRHGITREVAATVGTLTETQDVTADARPATSTGRLGLALRALRPEEKRAAQTDGALVVEAVNGLAARAGIRPGDVILRLNDTPVSSIEQLRQLTEKTGQHVALLIQRDNTTLYLPIPLG
jgi:serine protease Do